MSARAELGRLEAGGLIEIAALQPELEYLFRHALVQEAAYATLLKRDRRTLHRAAADTILSLHPGREREMAGVVAMHLEQAGETTRAAEFLVLAGDHALERFANREAMSFFVRALSLLDPTLVEIRLRAAVGAAKAGWTMTENNSNVDRLEAALQGEEQADRALVTEAYFWLAYLRRLRGDVPESSPQLKYALERAAQLGAELGDPSAAAMPRALMGSYTAFMGNLRAGAEQMREALALLENKGDPVSIAIVSDFLALAYARMGDFKSAEEVVARAKAAANAGDEISRIDLEIATSGIDLERGEPEKAHARAAECSARAEELGAFACVVASNLMIGASSLARQDAAGAKPPLERGSELCRVTNIAPMRTLTHALLASTRAQLGDLPAGVTGWDDALAGARSMRDRFGEAQTLWGRGRTRARLADPDWPAAFADLDRAVRLFEAMEARPSLARALHDRAGALRALGRAEKADADERRSDDLGRQLGLRDIPPGKVSS
ncbi:MAG TPA: hypothetical protein VJR46_03630 [Candidatus Dormibacteraeota bacterium]|nr:hypothetical protein [Candidatus Dormibacteraeota bacterium]